MTVKEKLQHEEGKLVHLWKEGAFWVAYEQSAFLVSQVKKLKPNKKFVKNVGMDIVTVGFPDSALGSISLQITERNEKRITMQPERAADRDEFMAWKNGINARCADESHSSNILEQIRCFDFVNSTPMECMNFLATLKLKVES